MKTPEEAKKGLAACKRDGDCDRGNCPYHSLGGGTKCIPAMCFDALALIQQLEAENAELKRERDAAVNELKHHCWNCKYHLNKPIEETDDYGRTIHRYCSADYCFPEEENSSWEWRGPCEENGGVA